jgi:hypothetical protein
LEVSIFCQDFSYVLSCDKSCATLGDLSKFQRHMYKYRRGTVLCQAFTILVQATTMANCPVKNLDDRTTTNAFTFQSSEALAASILKKQCLLLWCNLLSEGKSQKQNHTCYLNVILKKKLNEKGARYSQLKVQVLFPFLMVSL